MKNPSKLVRDMIGHNDEISPYPNYTGEEFRQKMLHGKTLSDAHDKRRNQGQFDEEEIAFSLKHAHSPVYPYPKISRTRQQAIEHLKTEWKKRE